MYEENEISLKELILVLVSEKKLIAAITFGTTIIAILISFLLPNVYEAHSQIMFTIPSAAGSRFGTFVFPSQNVADYVSILDSLEIKNEVENKLELDSFVSSYSFDKDLKYVTVKTQANTPELAKEVNDLYVETYIDRINAQYKLIAIDVFIYNHQMNLSNLNYQRSTTESMIIEKSAFLEMLNPVYTLQKAMFSDPNSAALYAEKFNLDLSSLSNDVVLEEFVNQKYIALEGEIVDLKISLINMNESIKSSELLLEELVEKKTSLESKLVSSDYSDELNDELTVLKNGISRVSIASTPKERISPRRSMITILGLVLGAGSAVFIAFFKRYWLTQK